MRIGILASGTGTILQALLDADLPIVVVLVDRACAATERAEKAGVPVEIIARDSFGADFDRLAYTHRVVDALERHGVDLVAMAGFGTILEKPIHDRYEERIVNTHPALLPAFKGWHAVDDALAAGVKVTGSTIAASAETIAPRVPPTKVTGSTIHYATLEVDDGPILAQEAVPVLPDDTADTLHERIKDVERRLYPAVLWQLVRDEEHDDKQDDKQEDNKQEDNKRAGPV